MRRKRAKGAGSEEVGRQAKKAEREQAEHNPEKAKVKHRSLGIKIDLLLFPTAHQV